jgi:hypothetical protein
MTCLLRARAKVAATSLVLALGLLTGARQAADQDGVAATIHVAPHGRDNWSGTLAAPNAAKTDGPFATITRARDRVRRLRADSKPGQPVVVYLHAGRYELTEPLTFTPEDSGIPQSPTIYAAAPGDEGQVVISGGRIVRQWRPARGTRGEWVADLPALKEG